MIIEMLGVKFKVRRPVVRMRDEPYDLTFFLPTLNCNYQISLPEGYGSKNYSCSDNQRIVALLNKAGFGFTPKRITEALSYCIPGGVHLIQHENTGTLVSMMMSRHLASEEFEFGGRIDWLATDPDHRGKGLGEISAMMATRHLIDRGYTNIYVTTQPSRPAALKIFLKIGYQPTRRTLVEYDWDLILSSLSK